MNVRLSTQFPEHSVIGFQARVEQKGPRSQAPQFHNDLLTCFSSCLISLPWQYPQPFPPNLSILLWCLLSRPFFSSSLPSFPLLKVWSSRAVEKTGIWDLAGSQQGRQMLAEQIWHWSVGGCCHGRELWTCTSPAGPPTSPPLPTWRRSCSSQDPTWKQAQSQTTYHRLFPICVWIPASSQIHLGPRIPSSLCSLIWISINSLLINWASMY